MDYTGQQIGSYYLDRFLGRGHFAEVYLVVSPGRN